MLFGNKYIHPVIMQVSFHDLFSSLKKKKSLLSEHLQEYPCSSNVKVVITNVK